MLYIPDANIQFNLQRWKLLRVTPEALIALCQMDGSYRLSAEGMPEDARPVHIFTETPWLRMAGSGNAEGQLMLIGVVIESESFDLVDPSHLPELSVRFTKHYEVTEVAQ